MWWLTSTDWTMALLWFHERDPAQLSFLLTALLQARFDSKAAYQIQVQIQNHDYTRRKYYVFFLPDSYHKKILFPFYLDYWVCFRFVLHINISYKFGTQRETCYLFSMSTFAWEWFNRQTIFEYVWYVHCFVFGQITMTQSLNKYLKT